MSSKTYRHNCASAMQIEQEPCIALDFQYLSIRKDAARQCKLSKLLCIALDFHYLCNPIHQCYGRSNGN